MDRVFLKIARLIAVNKILSLLSLSKIIEPVMGISILVVRLIRYIVDNPMVQIQTVITISSINP